MDYLTVIILGSIALCICIFFPFAIIRREHMADPDMLAPTRGLIGALCALVAVVFGAGVHLTTIDCYGRAQADLNAQVAEYAQYEDYAAYQQMEADAQFTREMITETVAEFTDELNAELVGNDE